MKERFDFPVSNLKSAYCLTLIAIIGMVLAGYWWHVNHRRDYPPYEFELNQALNKESARRLTQMGKRAVPLLIDALQHEDDVIRSGAALALGNMSPPPREAVPALIQALSWRQTGNWIKGSDFPPGTAVDREVLALIIALKDSDLQRSRTKKPIIEPVQTSMTIFGNPYAYDALGKIGPDALPMLLEAAENDNADIRREVFRLFGEFGPDAREAIPVLLRGLQSDDFIIPEWALAGIGEDAIPGLLNLLESNESRNRWKAIRTLSRIEGATTKTMPALIRSLDDKDYQVRATAAFALGKIGSAAIPAIPALIRLTYDSAEHFGIYEVRGDAISALGKIGPAAEDAVPVLLEWANDSDMNFLAIVSLGEIHSRPELVVPVLIQSTFNSSHGVRANAMVALGKFGPLAHPAVDALSEALRDQEPAILDAAATALGRIGSAAGAAEDDLLRLVGTASCRAGEKAIVALGNIRSVSDTAVATLERIVKHNECSECRLSAIEALWKITRYPPAGKTLRTMMKEGEISTRLRAARMAGRLGFPRKWVLEACRDAMEHSEVSDAFFEGRLVVELANDSSGPSVPLLIEAFNRLHPYWRVTAAEALGRSGSAAAEALPALENALTDDEDIVRAAARKAIRQIRDTPQ